MRKQIFWFLFFISFTLISSEFTILNGKHLNVVQLHPLLLNNTQNASDHAVKIESVEVKTLNALSKRFNFTYSFLHINDTRLEKQKGDQPGLVDYMANGKCDLVIGPILMTPKRFAVMDFAPGYLYTQIALLIPMPELSDQALASIFKPFQTTVWITLLIAMPIMAVVIYFFIRPMSWMTLMDQDPPENATTIKKIGQVLFQIFRILVNQGGNFPRMRNAIYFAVGSWCLTALVLVCSYNGLLTTYILGSTAEPLVDSLADLAKNSNVHLAVDKGHGADILISEATVGIYKILGDKLRSNPNSRCVTRQKCIDLVKSGSYVYLRDLPVIIRAIDEDYKATGKCNLAIARKTDSVPGSLAWALPKKSPYTQLFSKGFQELHEKGSIDKWMKMELEKYSNVHFCLNEARKRQQRKVTDNKIQISLKNFAGAFYVLIIGYFISFIVFVRENISFRIAAYRMRSSRNNTKQTRIVTNQNTADKNVERAIIHQRNQFANFW